MPLADMIDAEGEGVQMIRSGSTVGFEHYEPGMLHLISGSPVVGGVRRPVVIPIEQRSNYLTAAANATTQATPTAQSSAAPYGYSNLPSGFNWQKLVAPVTGDPVYLGSYNGQTVYVGPNNQPMIGSSGDFYHGSNGTVNPIMTQARAISWADLGVKNANNTVAASTYNGPGADSAAQNDAAQKAIVAQAGGETLSIGSTAVSNLNPAYLNQTGAFAPPGTQAVPAPSTGSSGAASGGSSSSGSDPNAFANQLLGGMGGGVPGSGSIAGGVGVADGTTPLTATPTKSSSAMLPILLIVAVAIGGFIFWQMRKKKHGGASGGGEGGEKHGAE